MIWFSFLFHCCILFVYITVFSMVDFEQLHGKRKQLWRDFVFVSILLASCFDFHSVEAQKLHVHMLSIGLVYPKSNLALSNALRNSHIFQAFWKLLNAKYNWILSSFVFSTSCLISWRLSSVLKSYRKFFCSANW